MARKVHFISLGCARNRVDTEVMMGALGAGGWEYVPEPVEADAVVVNTCGFIESAKEESVDTILEVSALKESRPQLRLVVAGCLTQRYRSQLASGLPEVDLFLGTDQYPRLAELLDELETAPAEPGPRVHTARSPQLLEHLPRVNTLTAGAAYLKVAEGCEHNCAYCIIPAIRGRLRSRSVDGLAAEAQALASQGVKELNLVAQDLAAFGRERGGGELIPLLQRLATIDGLRWLRLLYFYPEYVASEFLELLASEPKIVKYLDVPMQHGSSPVLSRMNRDVTREQLLEAVARLRAYVPGITLRTSVIVGFPGETDEEFADLVSFVRETEFDHLGCFLYSQEEGTVAGRMKDQVPEAVKKERQETIMGLQQAISAQRLSRLVGTRQDVLLEGVHDGVWHGRIAAQAPEVDGITTVAGVRSGAAGDMVSATILRTNDYDLFARS